MAEIGSDERRVRRAGPRKEKIRSCSTLPKIRIVMRDPIELEIFKNIYHSIAEEMGAALRRTAFSPNIKERRDYSCAVFNREAEAIAIGDHMPDHPGSRQLYS